jgi:hypothetical protein
MIDTPQNCFRHAAASRSAAQGPMLENVRRKHLASATAWETLAAILVGRRGDRHMLRLSKLPEFTPDSDGNSPPITAEA